MTSITDVYEGDARRVASSRRRLVGTALFAVGAGMIVTAIAVATTSFGVGTFGRYGARELAGVLAGLGLPAVVLGVFVVLPASRVTRAASVIGASLALFGVALFQQAYPYDWVAGAPLFALATTAVYVAGVGTTFWCLFVALATFKTRRDPGGTATMEITEEGKLRLVEESRSLPGIGSVGLFGQGPDGSVPTQTNRPDEFSTDGVSKRSTDDGATVLDGGSNGPSAHTDGGSATVSGTTHDAEPQPEPDVTNDAEFLTAARERGRPDAYCGNCEHFEYVKVDGEIEPFCGVTQSVMDDMDACEEWAPNKPA